MKYRFPKESDYPRYVNVGKHRYQIHFVNNLEDYGNCQNEPRIIRLRKGMRPATIMRTFLHELAHACEFEYGIELQHEFIYLLERVYYLSLRGFFSSQESDK
jgi:hypothetical protein